MKKFLSKLDEDDLSRLSSLIKAKSRRLANVDAKKAVEAHDYIVGKCFKIKEAPTNGLFPEMYKYYKVISSRSINQYRATALTFWEHPFYWFDYQASKIGSAGDYYFGYFDFESIEAEDVPFFCNNGVNTIQLDYFTEITQEEYDAAMDNYIKELKEMPWTPDHYRFGNKLPTDKNWKQKNVYERNEEKESKE